MLLNDLVNLLHQADGLREREHDVLVVGDVFLRKPPALPVLEPSLADLVTVDPEVPYS